LIDSPIDVEKLNHIPIPKQLPKAESQYDNQMSDLLNTESKSKVYDFDSDDNYLLGLEGGPGTISGTDNFVEKSNPQNTMGEFNNSNGFSGMSGKDASGNTHGKNISGTGVSDGISGGEIKGGDVKSCKERDIIPLLNADPIY